MKHYEPNGSVTHMRHIHMNKAQRHTSSSRRFGNKGGNSSPVYYKVSQMIRALRGFKCDFEAAHMNESESESLYVSVDGALCFGQGS